MLLSLSPSFNGSRLPIRTYKVRLGGGKVGEIALFGLKTKAMNTFNAVVGSRNPVTVDEAWKAAEKVIRPFLDKTENQDG